MNPNEKYQPLIDDKIKKTTTQIIQAPYDPYKVPPNFDEAEAHYYATRIAKPIELPGGNHVHDKASGLQIENQPLGLCSDKEELNFLSPGYPMYFQWVRFTMFIGFVIIVFSGVFNLQSFYSGSNCLSEDTFVAQTTNQSQSNTTVSSFVLQRFLQSENMTDEQLAEVTETCPRNMVNRFSLANRIGDDAALEKTDIYNFFTIIILLLCMQFIRKIQKQTAILCDERAITASDFTAKVTNIPKDFTEKEDIDEEIRKFFITNGVPGKTVEVKNVSVCYNCDAIVQEDKKLKEAVQLRATLLAKKSKKQLVSDDDIRKVEASIETCKKNIASISKKFEEGVGVSKQFEGEAYVTFETQQELQAVVQNWHLGRLARIRESLISNSKYKFRKNILTVREAPEPSDVYWENAGTPHITKLTLRVITNIVTIIVLFAGFYTVFTINSAKVNLLSTLSQKNESAEEKSFILTFAVKSISIVASCVVVVVNMILRIVIMALTKREKFSTYTELQSTYAIRLALCQFCNTALITFAVAVYFRNITGPGGLTYTAFFIFLTNVVVQCGMTLFSPATIMYYIKKRGIEKNKADCLLTQEQLNAAYKLPEFDFATKYAGYAKTILSACFFAPLSPLVMVVATVGIVIEYSLDKYVMLRHRSRGRSIGTELPFEFVEFLEYCMVLFALGNFLANVSVTNFDPSDELLTMMGLVIGLLNAVLPMGKINERLFPAKDEALTQDTYSAVHPELPEDYNTSNPATADAAAKMCRVGDVHGHP